MLIWMTLLLLGEGAGGEAPPTPVANFFNRRRRRGWAPQS